ncbi:hypothetical protein FB451DRAFT_1390705 [Mycena latifolia]|nr:hypothetical protein FB451DRAFT_1390705 [Mycena latifolia]
MNGPCDAQRTSSPMRHRVERLGGELHHGVASELADRGRTSDAAPSAAISRSCMRTPWKSQDDLNAELKSTVRHKISFHHLSDTKSSGHIPCALHRFHATTWSTSMPYHKPRNMSLDALSKAHLRSTADHPTSSPRIARGALLQLPILSFVVQVYAMMHILFELALAAR